MERSSLSLLTNFYSVQTNQEEGWHNIHHQTQSRTWMNDLVCLSSFLVLTAPSCGNVIRDGSMLSASSYWRSSSRDQVLLWPSLYIPWQFCVHLSIEVLIALFMALAFTLQLAPSIQAVLRVCGIWGIPLFLWRNLVLCYMAKLMPQFIHTFCGDVFHPTHYKRYMMNITTSQAVLCSSLTSTMTWYTFAAYHL